MWLRHGAFLQEQEGGQAGNREQRGGDQHRHRHEIRSLLALSLRPGHISEAGAQAHQAADIAQAPSPSRHLAERATGRQFRQECRYQILAAAVKKIGKHDQRDGEPQAARPGKRKQRGKQHAADGGQHQQLFLGGIRIRISPDHRCGEHDRGIRDRQCSRPCEGRPRLVVRHHRDEIGIENRGDDYRGVAGVGEIVHRPCPDFARSDGFSKRMAHGFS